MNSRDLGSGLLCRQAVELLEIHKPEQALVLLRQAAAADPNDEGPHCLMALAYAALERWPAALASAERAAHLAPSLGYAHHLRSTVLQALGKKRAALEAAHTAARLAPEDPEILFTLGVAQGMNALSADAEATGQRLLTLVPQAVWGYRLLAASALQAKRWKEAEAQIRQALAIDPQDAESFHMLGIALQAQHKTPDAVDMLQQSVRLDPAGPDFRKQRLAESLGTRINNLLLFSMSGLLLAEVSAFSVVRYRGLSVSAREAWSVIAFVLPLMLMVSGWVWYAIRKEVRAFSTPLRTLYTRDAHQTAGTWVALGLPYFFLAVIVFATQHWPPHISR